jgi:hypothetical protein
MNELAETVKKYGVTGVLAVWISIQQMEVVGVKSRMAEVEDRLFDCYEDKEVKQLYKSLSLNDVFIKPKQIKIQWS